MANRGEIQVACKSRHAARRAAIALWLVVSFVGLPTAAFADWTEFRGPTGQGHVAGVSLPVQWDLAQDAVWNVEVPGKGWSSPIVLQHKVYLTTAVPVDDGDDKGMSLRTLCLDAASGKTIWDVEVFRKKVAVDEKIHKKNSFASPTPITDGQRVYVHFGPDGTAALDLDGKVLWKNEEIKYNPQHGAGGSPIFSGNRLVFTCDGVEKPFVIALDRETGQVAWKTFRPDCDGQRYSFATPLEIEVQGRKQLVCPASHMVCSYDAETGEELWRVRYPDKWSVIPRPVFAHGLVFVCTGYDGPAELLAIRPDGRDDVTDTHVAWRTDDQVPHSPSLLIVGEDLFFVSDNGIASCRDALTGKLHWRQRLGGNYSASPIFAQGKIYFLSEQGMCTVIEAQREFVEVAKNDFDEATLASFAVVDAALIVRTESRLFRIENR